MKRPNFLVGIFLAAFIFAGCTVGPNYKRPVINTPSSYRGDTTTRANASTPAAAQQSLGDAKWWTVFEDKQLQALVRVALEQNYDVRIAATRVLEAQAQLGITRADQFPTLSAGANLNTTRNAKNPVFQPFQVESGEVELSAAWELDFWGKYRRATEAARADLLASEWGRRAVISTLVSDVASSYFELRALDLELDISKETLASRQDSLKLEQALEQNGSVSLVDVRQSEQLVYTASETVPDIERQIQQQENQISILLGQNPGAVERGLELVDQPHPPTVPVGLPSDLLERRPDIRQSEQNLIAANALIGVARAAYFPSISLTGDGGFQSDSLARLFTSPAGLWNFGPSLTQPIFTAGKIHSNVKLAEAQQQEALLTYQQTIQQAFRDVSDALIAYQKDREFREQQELLTASAQDATRLSSIRYNNGVASYLEVLTNETNSFSAQLNLAQARLNELDDLVHLYAALGGGWQE
ncbi:MAG TPA: efflux transporter outer membrane subunit [Candidatus Acidoferrum sp.]|nr:efflux transporter outer membrane subunit [Candidatus Acidoferrum sp.]